ncbi:MAG TPA: hypothetical protein VGX69_10160 [Solirubrobacteraceae bacterium]|jgi:hypothetical protein|nr:hypothetical protein [Solirubrobacteraceae bacterium]
MRAWTTQRGSAAVASAVATALVCAAVALGSAGLLCLLPALLLACTLFARRYPGERALLALRRAGRARRWPRPRAARATRARVVTVAAHGGLLIARSLAVRPPPAPAAAT